MPVYIRELFRSSRPDFIETTQAARAGCSLRRHCSGLPGRTSLRHRRRSGGAAPAGGHCSGLPGRTSLRRRSPPVSSPAMGPVTDCSGLPGRTSLRLYVRFARVLAGREYCSGLPGRTSLRPILRSIGFGLVGDCSGLPGRTSLRPRMTVKSAKITATLFRSSRPDFIETY